MSKKISQAMTILTVAFLITGWGLALPAPASAVVSQSQIWGTGVKEEIEKGPLGGAVNNDPRLLAVNIINIALGFLGIIAVILILYAGFRWMTAGGNEENVATAKKILIAGIIGLIIILASFALANFVINQLIGATTGTIPT